MSAPAPRDAAPYGGGGHAAHRAQRQAGGAVPDRARLHGRGAGARAREVAGPDPARGGELPDQRAAPGARPHRGAGPDQGGSGPGQRRTRRAGRGVGGGGRAAAEEVADGALGRAVPGRRLPDRLRHLLQHEHQRGRRDARHRTAGRARAPQRPRQREPVVQRRLPLLDPHRRRPSAVTARPDPGAGAPRGVAGAQGRRSSRTS